MSCPLFHLFHALHVIGHRNNQSQFGRCVLRQLFLDTAVVVVVCVCVCVCAVLILRQMDLRNPILAWTHTLAVVHGCVSSLRDTAVWFALVSHQIDDPARPNQVQSSVHKKILLSTSTEFRNSGSFGRAIQRKNANE